MRIRERSIIYSFLILRRACLVEIRTKLRERNGNQFNRKTSEKINKLLF